MYVIQMLPCRLRDEHAVSARQLQLEVSSLKADHARLAQEAAQAQTSLEAVKDSLAAAERQAQQVGSLPTACCA